MIRTVEASFLGPGIRAVNVWLALSRCGRDAPGLDLLPRRLDHIVETGTHGSYFDWAVGPDLVATLAEETPIVRPEFEAGDALVFDDLFLHRTAVAEGVRIMRALGSDLGVPVLLHGEEGGAWPVLEYAMGLNIDTRIGFEDVLVLPDGWLATGNDNLVSKALEIGSGKRA